MSVDATASTHIYVMGTAVGDIAYKIGHATQPGKRRIGLNGGSPFGVRLLGSVSIPRDLAHPVERSLHRRYSATRVGGEWFALPAGKTEKQFITDVLECADLFARCHRVSRESGKARFGHASS